MEVLAVFFLQPGPQSKPCRVRGHGPSCPRCPPSSAGPGLSQKLMKACPVSEQPALGPVPTDWGLGRGSARVQTSGSRLSAHSPQHPDPHLLALRPRGPLWQLWGQRL